MALSPEQAAAVNAQVDRLTAVKDALVGALNGLTGSPGILRPAGVEDSDFRARVDNWTQTAAVWSQMAPAIIDGSNPRVDAWGALGGKLAQSAADLADAMESDTAKEKVRAFVFNFPAALQAAGAGLLAAASAGTRAILSAAFDALPWPLWIVGAVAVGVVAWLYLGAPMKAES